MPEAVITVGANNHLAKIDFKKLKGKAVEKDVHRNFEIVQYILGNLESHMHA